MLKEGSRNVGATLKHSRTTPRLCVSNFRHDCGVSSDYRFGLQVTPRRAEAKLINVSRTGYKRGPTRQVLALAHDQTRGPPFCMSNDRIGFHLSETAGFYEAGAAASRFEIECQSRPILLDAVQLNRDVGSAFSLMYPTRSASTDLMTEASLRIQSHVPTAASHVYLVAPSPL